MPASRVAHIQGFRRWLLIKKAGGMKHPARFCAFTRRPLVRVRVAVAGGRFFFLFRLLSH